MDVIKDRDIAIKENSEDLSIGSKFPEKKEKEINFISQNPDFKRTYLKTNNMWKDYLDFELEIEPGSGRDYPIAVIRSPAGEARSIMHFPFDELALENALKDIQIALLRSGGKNRQVLSPEEQTVKDFGQKLFDTVLNGDLRSCYDVSLREAAQHGKGLRLKLRIKPPELAALPWEFLYDSHQADYISLSSNTPVVRYLELPQAIRPLSLDPPLHILGMIANPSDLVPLDVEREKQRIEEAIRDLRERGLVDIMWLSGQTWEDLQQAMRTGIWHIFHFIGHGGFDRNADEGLIALSDENGQTFRLGATQLGRFLAGHNHLRLVILNSCEGARGSKRDIFSSTASILVRRGIPAVLAMQYEITDKAAIEFSRAFYQALQDGIPVDAAVAEARIAVSVAVTNTIEWGTPVLYMRSPDGVLFRIQKPYTPPIIETRKDEIKEKEEINIKLILKLSADAQGLFETGNYSEAIEKWQKVLSLDPGDNRAIEGIKESERILKEGEHLEYLKLSAEAQRWFETGTFSEAIKKWEAVLKIDPNDSKAIEGMKESERILKEREDQIKLAQNYSSKAFNKWHIFSGKDSMDLAKEYERIMKEQMGPYYGNWGQDQRISEITKKQLDIEEKRMNLMLVVYKNLPLAIVLVVIIIFLAYWFMALSATNITNFVKNLLTSLKL